MWNSMNGGDGAGAGGTPGAGGFGGPNPPFGGFGGPMGMPQNYQMMMMMQQQVALQQQIAMQQQVAMQQQAALQQLVHQTQMAEERLRAAQWRQYQQRQALALHVHGAAAFINAAEIAESGPLSADCSDVNTRPFAVFASFVSLDSTAPESGFANDHSDNWRWNGGLWGTPVAVCTRDCSEVTKGLVRALGLPMNAATMTAKAPRATDSSDATKSAAGAGAAATTVDWFGSEPGGETWIAALCEDAWRAGGCSRGPACDGIHTTLAMARGYFRTSVCVARPRYFGGGGSRPDGLPAAVPCPNPQCPYAHDANEFRAVLPLKAADFAVARLAAVVATDTTRKCEGLRAENGQEEVALTVGLIEWLGANGGAAAIAAAGAAPNEPHPLPRLCVSCRAASTPPLEGAVAPPAGLVCSAGGGLCQGVHWFGVPVEPPARDMSFLATMRNPLASANLGGGILVGTPAPQPTPQAQWMMQQQKQRQQPNEPPRKKLTPSELKQMKIEARALQAAADAIAPLRGPGGEEREHRRWALARAVNRAELLRGGPLEVDGRDITRRPFVLLAVWKACGRAGGQFVLLDSRDCVYNLGAVATVRDSLKFPTEQFRSLCQHFHTRGACSVGDNCMFIHMTPETTSAYFGVEQCRYTLPPWKPGHDDTSAARRGAACSEVCPYAHTTREYHRDMPLRALDFAVTDPRFHPPPEEGITLPPFRADLASFPNGGKEIGLNFAAVFVTQTDDAPDSVPPRCAGARPESCCMSAAACMRWHGYAPVAELAANAERGVLNEMPTAALLGGLAKTIVGAGRAAVVPAAPAPPPVVIADRFLIESRQDELVRIVNEGEIAENGPLVGGLMDATRRPLLLRATRHSPSALPNDVQPLSVVVCSRLFNPTNGLFAAVHGATGKEARSSAEPPRLCRKWWSVHGCSLGVACPQLHPKSGGEVLAWFRCAPCLSAVDPTGTRWNSLAVPPGQAGTATSGEAVPPPCGDMNCPYAHHSAEYRRRLPLRAGDFAAVRRALPSATPAALSGLALTWGLVRGDGARAGVLRACNETKRPCFCLSGAGCADVHGFASSPAAAAPVAPVRTPAAAAAAASTAVAPPPSAIVAAPPVVAAGTPEKSSSATGVDNRTAAVAASTTTTPAKGTPKKPSEPRVPTVFTTEEEEDEDRRAISEAGRAAASKAAPLQERSTQEPSDEVEEEEDESTSNEELANAAAAAVAANATEATPPSEPAPVCEPESVAEVAADDGLVPCDVCGKRFGLDEGGMCPAAAHVFCTGCLTEAIDSLISRPQPGPLRCPFGIDGAPCSAEPGPVGNGWDWEPLDLLRVLPRSSAARLLRFVAERAAATAASAAVAGPTPTEMYADNFDAPPVAITAITTTTSFAVPAAVGASTSNWSQGSQVAASAAPAPVPPPAKKSVVPAKGQPHNEANRKPAAPAANSNALPKAPPAASNTKNNAAPKNSAQTSNNNVAKVEPHKGAGGQQHQQNRGDGDRRRPRESDADGGGSGNGNRNDDVDAWRAAPRRRCEDDGRGVQQSRGRSPEGDRGRRGPQNNNQQQRQKPRQQQESQQRSNQGRR